MAKKHHREWILCAERRILSAVHKEITNRTQCHEQIRNRTHGLKQHLKMNEAGYLELRLSLQCPQFCFFFFPLYSFIKKQTQGTQVEKQPDTSQ